MSTVGRPSVAVDGVIYSYQRQGGITRMLSAILPRVLELDPELRLELWSWSRQQADIPRHERLHRKRTPYAPVSKRSRPVALQRLLRKATATLNDQIRCRWVQRSRASLWHATLYWRPANWRGAVLTNVYDLKEERFPELGPYPEASLRSRRDAITSADCVLCISETTRRDVMEFYGISKEKLRVMPLAVDRSLFHPGSDNQTTDGDPFLLFVGRRDRFKNFDLLLDAYRDWRWRDRVRLLVVGPKPTPAEQRITAEFGTRIEFRSEIDDTQLALLYRQAAALVHTSRYEGFGLTLLEAMACACPIVASRIPTSEEIAGPAAWFFELDSKEELHDALEGAISAGRRHLRVNSGLQLSAEASWDRCAASLLEIYRPLLS